MVPSQAITAAGLLKIILEVAGFGVPKNPKLYIVTRSGGMEQPIPIDDPRFVLLRPPGRYLLELPALTWDEDGEILEAQEVSVTYDVTKQGTLRLVLVDLGIREVAPGSTSDGVEKDSITIGDKILIALQSLGNIASAITEALRSLRGG